MCSVVVVVMDCPRFDDGDLKESLIARKAVAVVIARYTIGKEKLRNRTEMNFVKVHGQASFREFSEFLQV